MYLTKGEALGIVGVMVLVLSVKNCNEQATPTIESEADAAYEEAWEAQGSKYLDEISSTFDPDTLEYLPPPAYSLGLSINGSEPPCVDTYKIDDVNCADKAAVVKYRKARQAEEVKRIKLKILKLERLKLEIKFGLLEC